MILAPRPPGWLHWLVGDGAAYPAATPSALGDGTAPPAVPPHVAHGWHALFGGSFFPDCHEFDAHATRGLPRPQTAESPLSHDTLTERC